MQIRQFFNFLVLSSAVIGFGTVSVVADEQGSELGDAQILPLPELTEEKPMSVIPEPTAMGLIAVVGMLLIVRRRR